MPYVRREQNQRPHFRLDHPLGEAAIDGAIGFAQLDPARKRIAGALERQGVKMLRAEVVRPSLEDVFVSLIRSAETMPTGETA